MIQKNISATPAVSGPVASGSAPAPVRLSLAEYDLLLAQGILDERRHQKIELIQGEMCEMSPPGPMHDEMVNHVTDWCYDSFDRRVVKIRVQSGIGLPDLDSAPQPDVAVVEKHDYSEHRPETSNVLLNIEVSDSGLAFDRNEKANLYAAAGVKDYWIVNLQDWCVEVYREPAAGGYREKRTFDAGETVAPLAFSEMVLDIAALFRQ